MAGAFQWGHLDQGNIVADMATAVAVYANPRDEIVIRRQGGFDAEDDVVVVPLKVAEALLRRMENLIREIRAETALS
ncbi:hypothetical protein [Nitrospirillum viridazoti]|uniref:Uncharacterized protein n=2 Tax=Nitrospirillum TaxID=1543705 RepID=A0A248JS91_9PROT|nr:hypothetical protein [Nitrospirillum amazonense]ASG21104.1 hypothetical protein Y958_09915 [Nitrospirillum amazonense CBAmc]TWB26147.1 hypothetical protein FBZ91_1439 [Nitrospirillum amazonense]TWB27016.1 hypothetical protein FBZ88_107184 [Nitrospirillum amazonense]TWB48694.1 hypothetical protein FBZ92_12974 [Nitrospirillum amazonense]